jgi:predicted nuclease of predicted toxin-antitoxin system
MRFLANENFPAASVQHLRQSGHDVLYVSENFPSVEDEVVLRWARDEQRFMLTFDRDYGELIFKHQLPVPLGVIYLRFDPATPLEPAEMLLRLLQLPAMEWSGRFTVLTRDQIRQRHLPQTV